MAEALVTWMAVDESREEAARTVQTAPSVLLQAWRQGDAAAFESLVTVLHPLAFRVALRLLGNREDAEDAVQETFWRLYRAGSGIRNPDGLQAWIYRATVNAVRSRQARAVRRSEPSDTGDAGSAASQAADAEKVLLLRDAVQRALQCLSPKEREVLVLRDIEGLETSEVAAAMGVFEVTVRTHLSRGRLKLRQELIARGIHP